MKKQAYSAPQMKVVHMRTSRPVLFSTSDIKEVSSKNNNDVNDVVGIGWDNTPDYTETAY